VAVKVPFSSPCRQFTNAPLLGKTRQKQYIRRFASEAFAFLLRRVKDPSEIVTIILNDLDLDNEEYSEAVGNIFVESMKAPARSLHTKAVPLFTALIHITSNSGLTTLRII
jgi:U3 small nucleolar RNA-associated protein 20